jgi:serine/threonine-protein kinase
MGEVYRAEDLHLHRTVALKFLIGSRADDPVWLARFYNEARLSLAVTNRYVCRVYDIGQADDEAFICMEYVDGENLASLLKRIGRLTADKVVDIARQLCHGLAAAHTMGVLHRDLKPANIMLDGRGQVRITDFGIAALATPGSGTTSLAGTPGYMAPEVWSGEAATVRSDLYALGLILYEMLTGRKASPAISLDEEGEETHIVPPSQIIENVDPGLERAVLKCLAESPDDRPRSVYELLAMLPGGDPLAAALAAGETPSPELLAAVSAGPRFRSTTAKICLGASIVGLVVAVALAGGTTLFAQARLAKPPEVLDEIARRIVAMLGGSPGMQDATGCFFINPRLLDSPGEFSISPDTHLRETTSSSPSVFYEYRLWSNRDERNEVTVRLDPSGRLLTYIAVPWVTKETGTRPAPLDWSAVFTKAGLDSGKFTAITRPNPPPVFADEIRSWESVHGDSTAGSIQVDGAALEGQVVYFNVSRIPPTGYGLRDVGTSAVMTSTRLLAPIFLVTMAGSLVLAWRNLRLGRGDRRAAFRLAVFMFGLEMLRWWSGRGFLPQYLFETHELLSGLRAASFIAVAIWFYYLALEPYVRKYWPHTLLSWSRVVVGRWRDQVLGRDVLLGTAFGIAIVVVGQCEVLISAWMGQSPPPLWLPGEDSELGRLVGFGYITSWIALALRIAVSRAMILLMLMLLLRKIIRIPWLAVVTFILIATTFYALNTHSTTLSAWLICGIIAIAVAALLVRAGLLSVLVALFVVRLLLSIPITIDLHAWYFSTSAVGLAMIAGLLAFGTYAAFKPGSNPRVAQF